MKWFSGHFMEDWDRVPSRQHTGDRICLGGSDRVYEPPRYIGSRLLVPMG
jgi:hypothetical protein